MYEGFFLRMTAVLCEEFAIHGEKGHPAVRTVLHRHEAGTPESRRPDPTWQDCESREEHTGFQLGKMAERARS